MNNLQAYGSSDSETDTATKPPEKLIFRVERIVDDEEYISKVKPKAKNLKDFLPAAIAKEEESYESLLKKVKRKSDGAGITLEVASQEEEILEAQDFFTIPNDKDDKVLEDVPILPLKPEKHVKPFVFKPKQKMSVTDDITSLVGREARNQKIEFKTINIQDQMGDKAIQNDRDLTLDTPSEDDPFKV